MINPHGDPFDHAERVLTAVSKFLAIDEDDEEGRARQADIVLELCGKEQAELLIEMAMRGDKP